MKIKTLLVVGSAFAAVACAGPKKESTVAVTAPAAQQKTGELAKAANPVAPETKQQIPEFSCQRDKDVRSFEIEVSQPKGCELVYSKHGSKEKIASSAHGTTHCEQVRERVRGNLEAAGFKCGAPDNQAKAEASAGPKPASTPQ